MVYIQPRFKPDIKQNPLISQYNKRHAVPVVRDACQHSWSNLIILKTPSNEVIISHSTFHPLQNIPRLINSAPMNLKAAFGDILKDINNLTIFQKPSGSYYMSTTRMMLRMQKNHLRTATNNSNS